MERKEKLCTARDGVRLFLLIASLLQGCALSHGVRPVGEGNVALDVGLGGPIVDYMGGHNPVPLSQIGITYGLSDKTNLHGGFYPSGAAMFGLVGFEAGASHLVLEQDGGRPAVMVDGTLIGIGGDIGEGAPEGGFRPYLQTSAHGSWGYGSREHLVYTGPEFISQVAPLDSVFGWTLGHQANFGRWGLGTEVGWMAPFWDNLPPVVDYAGIGGRGAVSINFGVQVALGGQK